MPHSVDAGKALKSSVHTGLQTGPDPGALGLALGLVDPVPVGLGLVL